MDIYAIINEIKEFASECVWKQGEECIKAPDSTIELYLKSLMYPKDFEIFQHYKKIMIEEFRRRAKEELDWLNE